MTDRLFRVRALLDKSFPVLVVALVVLALLGGWFTYTTHVSPTPVTEERPGPSWQTTGSFNHSATVTENNSVYPVGTTLDNRSIYLIDIVPLLDGTYTFTYDASEDGDLSGTVSLEFVLRGVEENRENTTVVWQTTRTLQTASSDSLEPGETIRVPFSVDMNDTVNRVEVFNEELGDPPGQPEAVIRATVEFQGTVNGRTVDRVKDHTLPIALERRTYRPGRSGKVTEQHETTRTVTVERTYGPVRRIGGPAVLAAALFALAGLVVARHQDRIGLSPTERELLEYEDDRGDFDEWISTIRLPDEVSDLPRAEATSLGALVDFAIDTDNRVIDNPDDDVYYVIHDGYLYTYRPPLHRGEGATHLPTDSEDVEREQTDGESSPGADGSNAADEESESPDDTQVEE